MANNTTGILVFETSEYSVTATVLRAFLALFYMLVILFGNALTIAAVIKEDSLRKVGNSFIVSLAVTDILMAVLVIPLFTIDSIAHTSLGNILCVIIASSDLMFGTASILNISIISIDRYIAITDPLHYATRMTTKVAGSMICFVWTISGLISYLPIIINEILNARRIHMVDRSCYFDLVNPTIVVFVMISLFVPTLMMLSAYGMIFRVARKHEAQICQRADISNNLNIGQKVKQPTSLQRSHKAAKTLGLVITIFLICWMPNIAFTFLSLVSPNIAEPTSPIWEIVPWMAYSNSMFNPLIYAVCNRSFRMAFKKMLHVK